MRFTLQSPASAHAASESTSCGLVIRFTAAVAVAVEAGPAINPEEASAYGRCDAVARADGSLLLWLHARSQCSRARGRRCAAAQPMITETVPLRIATEQPVQNTMSTACSAVDTILLGSIDLLVTHGVAQARQTALATAGARP